ncbi:PREDICTED: uncharacterized protein LOC104824784 [Tarenaya hassleriana]|uniref:uncharacterized protein LOC104824784 n=1 Tax=Tarenaya hassleriana TaxID=28532 RepID=UPI0008FD7708|nr:PREDICTED: uncharacterized protein LOC104824784 [Tarenaya hassleriana]
MSTDAATSAGSVPPATDNVLPYDPANLTAPLININVVNVTKLSATNYLTWSLQFRSLLEGYNLQDFLNPAMDIAPTITEANVEKTNPRFSPWFRQDRLIFSSLLGSISLSCQALIARATTTSEAWTTLASTYGRSSRGHIKQIKDTMKRFTKGGKSIDEYMHFFKCKADELALLGKPLDHEDLVDLILAGLSDDFKPVIDAINARDSPISFVELHERLLNHESVLLSVNNHSSVLPITANNTQSRSHEASSRPPWQHQPRASSDSSASHNRKPSQGYKGKCKLCGVQGHSAKRCHLLRSPGGPSLNQPSLSPWQPRAHHTSLAAPPTPPTWLLDSGASHHITSDLTNLSLHAPYTGGDDVELGDGSSHPITHSGEGSRNGSATHNRNA